MNQKPLEFKASALDYFILTILSAILIYIPFLGWALLLNYTGQWFAQRAKVNGQSVSFTSQFGESLKFVSINALLLIITFGIYGFWFGPKLYSYFAEHTTYSGAVEATAMPAEMPASTPVAQDEEAAVKPEQPVTATPEQPVSPQPPTSPQV